MKKELLKGLSEEQIAKVKGCKNSEELLALAKDEGVELSNEQLESVNGGCFSSDGNKCPHCGYDGQQTVLEGSNFKKLYCRQCGKFIKDL